MRVSGFSIVRNAELLDFPVEASIRSILPICDEVVVNVGRSEDRTLELVRAIGDPKLRILETEWELERGEALLRTETLRAMGACRHPWGICIQADEVLHEAGAPALRAAIEAADPDPRVEGIVVRYRHLFGDPCTEAVNRRWYRREVRAVRLDPAAAIHPYRDAQGFRAGAGTGGSGPGSPTRRCFTMDGSGRRRRSGPAARWTGGSTPDAGSRRRSRRRCSAGFPASAPSAGPIPPWRASGSPPTNRTPTAW